MTDPPRWRRISLRVWFTPDPAASAPELEEERERWAFGAESRSSVSRERAMGTLLVLPVAALISGAIAGPRRRPWFYLVAFVLGGLYLLTAFIFDPPQH